jgi:hypothetical protein
MACNMVAPAGDNQGSHCLLPAAVLVADWGLQRDPDGSQRLKVARVNLES